MLYREATSGTQSAFPERPLSSVLRRNRTYGRRIGVFSGSGAASSSSCTLSGTGTGVHDFGSAVAVDGSTAAVGAWIAKKGAAYVFSQTGSGWSQAAALTTSDNRIGFGAAAATPTVAPLS